MLWVHQGRLATTLPRSRFGTHAVHTAVLMAPSWDAVGERYDHRPDRRSHKIIVEI